jgi:ribonucleoside-diphosphate reductase alpha chain
VIERHMIEIGFLAPRSEVAAAASVPREGAPAHYCPRCGEASFVRVENCDSCLACGYSKCG